MMRKTEKTVVGYNREEYEEKIWKWKYRLGIWWRLQIVGGLIERLNLEFIYIL